ncbi:MAG: amidohydrolase family protein, partial [Chitinophagaceae bacterium]|nr:amidohydrolase family protein [Chitinophagaceae bacterium]
PEKAEILPGLIMPGLINVHCHIELSHMKGLIPKHTGLPQFLQQITAQRSSITPETIREAAQNAMQAMQASGIVAVGDICNTDLLSQLKRPLQVHHFVECFGLNEAQSLNRFMDALAVFNTLSTQGPCSLVLHAPYSVSPALIRLVDDFNRNKISTIHHQESEEEHRLFLEKQGEFLGLFERVRFDAEQFYFYGQRSSEAVLGWNQQAKHLILVHNTASTQADIDVALQNKLPTYWCLCPKANEYIENTLPNIPLMMSNGLNIVLGTDSLASNDSLNLWEEMALIQTSYPNISNASLLQWATRNGAEALDKQPQLGSFETGKQPGIIHLPNFKVESPLEANPKVAILFAPTSF